MSWLVGAFAEAFVSGASGGITPSTDTIDANPKNTAQKTVEVTKDIAFSHPIDVKVVLPPMPPPMPGPMGNWA